MLIFFVLNSAATASCIAHARPLRKWRCFISARCSATHHRRRQKSTRGTEVYKNLPGINLCFHVCALNTTLTRESGFWRICQCTYKQWGNKNQGHRMKYTLASVLGRVLPKHMWAPCYIYKFPLRWNQRLWTRARFNTVSCVYVRCYATPSATGCILDILESVVPD